MAESALDFDVLAEDNIRTLKVAAAVYRKPLCIILVGIPASGKTTLTKKLSEKFPLTVLSEIDITSFLAPRATIFQRNKLEVFQLALKTLEHLIKKGKACIYDANMKTREQRALLKATVEQAGGSYVLIFAKCPKEVCYERLQKHNLAVARGEAKGFILDKDYFEFEASSSQPPTQAEHHLLFDCQSEDTTPQIFTAVENRFKESN